MDQRTHDVEEDLKHILHTRLALEDKIRLVEQRVEDTVQGTKAAALEALDLARNKAADFIESATHHLNPSIQAGRRPWILVGSAVAIGLVAGLMEHRRRTSGIYAYYPPDAAGADVMPSPGREETDRPSGVYPFYSAGGEQSSSDRPARGQGRPTERVENRPRSAGRTSDMWRPLFSLWDELKNELIQERNRLQKTALHASRSFIHDVARIAGQSLLDQLNRSGSPSQRERPSRSRYE